MGALYPKKKPVGLYNAALDPTTPEEVAQWSRAQGMYTPGDWKSQLMQDLAGLLPRPGATEDQNVYRSLQAGMGMMGSRGMGGTPAGVLSMNTYHGSPNLFSKFDLGAKNPETGGSSFGKGINLSADKTHAQVYGKNIYKVDLPDEAIKSFIQWEKPVPSDLAKQVPQVDFSKPIQFGGGATVVRSGDQWLLKTGDSSFKLSEREVERMFAGDSGEQVYRRLVAALGDEKAASKWLNDRGVKGIENNTERGSQNFVVFDDQLPRILGRE
jgi:hypothetical protein